jgi:hypothetical protein
LWLYSLSREEKQLLFRAGNFCKAKDKEGGAENDRHGIKTIKEVSMQHLILLAVLSGDDPLRADHRWLFMLCWAARASDVLIPALLLNGCEHSLKSPLCSCVSITASQYLGVTLFTSSKSPSLHVFLANASLDRRKDRERESLAVRVTLDI